MRLRKLLPLIPDAAAAVIRDESYNDTFVAQLARLIIAKYDGKEVAVDKNSMLGPLWTAVSDQIDKQLDMHAEICRKRAEAGKAGGEAKAANKTVEQPKAAEAEQPAAPAAAAEVPKRRKFTKPTVEEVQAYCKEHSLNVDAANFVNFYESKGWVVGKSPMKNWHAALRTWTRNDNGGNAGKTDSYLEPTQQEKEVYGNLFG